MHLSVLAERCLELVESKQLNFETMLMNSNQLKQCCDEKNALQARLGGVERTCQQLSIDCVALQKRLDELNFEVNDLRVRVSTQESDRSEFLNKLNDLEHTKDVFTQKTAIRKEGEVCKNMFPKDKNKLDLSV